MAMEQVVKVLLALIVLVVIIATFYFLFKPSVDNVGQLGDKNKEGEGAALDDLDEIFGNSCESGKDECNPITNTVRECEDGKWVTTSRVCSGS